LAAPVQNGNPRILGFRCNWSVLGDAHAPLERQSYSSQNIEIIPVPCAGRVDPIHVLWALLNGADGVLLVGCPSGDCRYGSGSDEADDRMGTLKGLLDAHGFDSRRLQLERLRRDTPDAFDEAMRSFASKIRRLGRLPALPS
jgi:F420-non-reducing hydrogenase iron-sulfur subunit